MTGLSISKITLSQPSTPEVIRINKSTTHEVKTNSMKQQYLIIAELVKICDDYAIPVEENKLKSLSAFVMKFYADLFLEDLMDAFDYVANGEEEVEISNYGRPLTKDLLGRVFRIYATKVRPARAALKKDKPFGHEKKIVTPEQLAHQFALRYWKIKDAIEKNKGLEFLILNYLFEVLRKCGVTFTQEQIDKAESLAKDIVKRSIDRQRADNEIKEREFRDLMKDFERASSRSLNAIQIQQKNELVRMWVENMTMDFDQLKQFILTNYKAEQ